MNVMVRRPYVAVVVGVAMVGLLAGCGGSSSSSATASTGGATTSVAAPSSTGSGSGSGGAVLGPAVPSTSLPPVGLQRVGVQEFATAIAQPGVVILDVRTPAEYASGHLPNAVNIDVEAADFPAKVSKLDRGATYAVYCRSGNRSRVATQLMASLGFTSLYDLDGGINDWTQAGLPVVS